MQYRDLGEWDKVVLKRTYTRMSDIVKEEKNEWTRVIWIMWGSVNSGVKEEMRKRMKMV